MVNAPSDPTGSKFTVTFTKSYPGERPEWAALHVCLPWPLLPAAHTRRPAQRALSLHPCTPAALPCADTASSFLYKVYKLGTNFADNSTGNVVLGGGPIAMTPWINSTTTFTTDTVSPKGLYSVWVQAVHSDPTLNSSATTGSGTPYAIGEQGLCHVGCIVACACAFSCPCMLLLQLCPGFSGWCAACAATMGSHGQPCLQARPTSPKLCEWMSHLAANPATSLSTSTAQRWTT